MRIAKLIALAALLLLPFSASAAGPTVSLVPKPLQVPVGQTMPLELKIANVEGLYGFEMHATFDPAVIQIADADPNTTGVQLLPGAFLSYDFSVQNVADNAAGTLGFALAQINPSEAKSGSGTLLTILVTGKAAGKSAITFQFENTGNSQLSSRDGVRIEATWANGEVIVGAAGATAIASPTPLPTMPAPQIDLTTVVEQQALTPVAPAVQPTASEPPTATPAAPDPTVATGNTVTPAATVAPAAVTSPTADASAAATQPTPDALPTTADAAATPVAQEAAATGTTSETVVEKTVEQPAKANAETAVIASAPSGLEAPTHVESATQSRNSNTLLFVGGGLLALAAVGVVTLLVLRRGK